MKGSKGISRIILVVVLGSLIWWLFSNAMYEFGEFRNDSRFIDDFNDRNDVEVESDSIQDIVEEIPVDIVEKTKIEEENNIPPVVYNVIETVEDIVEVVVAELEEVILGTKDIVSEINNPGPLVTYSESSEDGALTTSGVLYYSNLERSNFGLLTLGENADLNRAAEIKVDDMFTNQYFEHMSPIGRDVSGLAVIVGYEYVSVGENLAMGNFDDDADLVLGWMNSPGHRDNILGEQYTEIGISVKEGMYEGNKIWMGVQIFGRPLSDCLEIDETLFDRIEVAKIVLDATSVLIDSMREDIESFSPKRGIEYSNLVNEFNELVEEYNSSSLELKLLVSEYNTQVNEFNKCITE